ncbi:MAG: cytochrome c biogenesis protein CcsA [Capsulimonadales bacterium]|nr:cytochrome c biogenesis protein CcsA [Capsulimonadales bacterium]
MRLAMAQLAKILLGIGTAIVVALSFLYLPAAEGFPSPELARIVALHLPNAMAGLVAAVAAGCYGWRYLAGGRNPLDDARSLVAAVLATIFLALTTVTGMVFAQVQWGQFWNWDPKQTCIFILLLIFAAYFVLRAGIEDEEKRATVSAVYILFAAVMTPVLGYMVPKYLPSLHPTNTSFDAAYHTVIWSASACLIGLYAWLFNLGVRYERLRLHLDAIVRDEP